MCKQRKASNQLLYLKIKENGQRSVQLQAPKPTQESAASSTQVVNSSYVCLEQNHMCHKQKLKFCNNEVNKYMI